LNWVEWAYVERYGARDSISLRAQPPLVYVHVRTYKRDTHPNSFPNHSAAMWSGNETNYNVKGATEVQFVVGVPGG